MARFSNLSRLDFTNPLVRGAAAAGGATIYNAFAPQRWGDLNPLLAGVVGASGHAPLGLAALGAAAGYNALTPGPDINPNLAVGGAIVAPYALHALSASRVHGPEAVLDDYLQSAKAGVQSHWQNFKTDLTQPISGGAFAEAREHLRDYLNQAVNYQMINHPTSVPVP